MPYRLIGVLSISAFLGASLAFAGSGSKAASKHQDHLSLQYDYEGFTEIDASGIYKLDVKVGPDYSLTLSGPKKEMDDIDIHMSGNRLYLAQKDKQGLRSKDGGDNREGVLVTLTLPRLVDVDVSGVVSGSITGINNDHLDVDISGVAELTLEGRCGELEAEVSGVGELDAQALKCKNVNVDLSGVGEVGVYAANSADIDAHGMGEVHVYGSPAKITKDKSFFTQINVHD